MTAFAALRIALIAIHGEGVSKMRLGSLFCWMRRR